MQPAAAGGVHGRATGGDIAGRSEAREEGAYLFSPPTAAAFGLAGRSGSWTGLPGQTDVVAIERQGGNTVALTLRIGSKRRLTVERKLTQKFAKAMPWSRRAGPKGS